MDQPFAPLTQQYETCSNNPTTAFFNQAGVSAGNVSILSPLGVMLVLCLLSLYQMCSGAHIAKSYSRKDKDEALDALAAALLLVRDKKLEQRQNGDSASRSTSTVSDSERTSTDNGVTTSTANHSKKKVPAKNGRSGVPGSSKEASSNAYSEERKSRVLAEIVEQLAEIAITAEQDKQLYQKHTEDPVYINWAALGRHMHYSLFGNSAQRNNKVSKQSESDSKVGDNVNMYDVSAEDVELTTVSQMHSHEV